MKKTTILLCLLFLFTTGKVVSHNSTFYNEKLRVSMGTEPTADEMTTELANYPDINTAHATPVSVTFTVPEDGIYYFGFQAYSDASQFILYLDDIKVEQVSTCLPPLDIQVENIQGGSAEVSWSAPRDQSKWEVIYGSTGFDPEREGEIVEVNGNPSTTIDGLELNTSYDLYVKAICEDGEESELVGPETFSTNCPPQEIPFFDGFENHAPDEHLDFLAGCWSQEIINNTYWTLNNSITANNRAPRSGEWDIFLAYGSDTWMFYPFQLEAGNTYTFSLYARHSNSSGASISVSYGDSDSAGAMTNEIVPTTEVTNGDYQNITGDFIPNASGTYYIGIKGHVNSGFYPDYMTVDDISLTQEVACHSPSDITIEEVDSNSATISWTPKGNETQWELKYGADGFDPEENGESISVEGDPTVDLTDLTSAHVYAVYVKAVCGDGESSEYYGPVTLKTTPINDDVCNAIDLEVGATCTSLYSNVGATIEEDEPVGTCFESPIGQTVWFTFTAPQSGRATVTTDFDEGTLKDTELAVYEAPTNCNLLNTLGQEIGCDEDGGEIGDGYLSTLKLEDLVPGNTYFVQVNGFKNFGEPFSEGTFCIEVRDDGFICPSPIDLTATNITDTTATVVWSPVGEETEWAVAYGNAGVDMEETELMWVTSPTAELEGLEPNTSYDVYVSAICSEDDSSNWTGPETFTTTDLGVEKNGFESFTFYPNPTEGLLYLKAGIPLENVTIYNLLGETIVDTKPNTTEWKLDTSHWQNGVYLMSVSINGTERTFKIIKK